LKSLHWLGSAIRHAERMMLSIKVRLLGSASVWETD
jgi:hypothetical protein